MVEADREGHGELMRKTVNCLEEMGYSLNGHFIFLEGYWLEAMINDKGEVKVDYCSLYDRIPDQVLLRDNCRKKGLIVLDDSDKIRKELSNKISELQSIYDCI